MSGAVFPAFLKLEHQQDGSARSSFLAEVAAITGNAEKQFERSFGEIRNIVSKSLSSFNGGQFKLSLNLPELRQAAADADFAAQRLRTMKDAATSLAASTGDTTSETRRYIQALAAQTTEAEAAKRAADAQVTTYQRLQQEIDRTISTSERMAQSYRDTYLEQARSINAATEAQRQFNNLAGIGRPIKSAASSASVFENQSYAPKADTSSNLQRMMSGSASIDRAAVSAATLDQVLGRISAKGPQVAAALTEAGRASEQSAITTARALEQVAAEQAAAGVRAAEALQRLSGEAAQLRSALDPTLSIQQRFDGELERADRLLAAGAISTREYASAQALARQNLQEAYAAITANSAAQEQAAKKGTTSQGAVTNSVRAHRTAMIQLGQQLQDMTVQWQGGANAMLIFGQQVPQAAFALSGLGGKIGSVASFLAGPWGAAVFVAIAALGPFVSKLVEAEDETTKAERAQRSFAQVLNDSTSSYKEVTAAAKAYADQQERSRATTLQQIQDEATAIATRFRAAISIREQLNAEMERYNFGVTHPGGVGGIIGTNSALAISGLDARKAENAKAIQQLQRDSSEVTVKAADAIAKIQSDPAERIKAGFDTLRQSARSTIKDVTALTARLADLNRQQTAAEKALKPSSISADRQYGREIDMSSAKSIASAAGFTVTSGQRSRAEQQWLYDHKRTAENPVALPGTSAHEKGNALDIAFGAGVSPASIKKAFADEGVRLTKILKETGHFHIEWSTSGADKAQRETDAIARAQQQLQEFGERSAESIQRINEQFNVQPKLVDQAAQATRKLDDIIKDLSARKPAGFEQMIADAQAAKGVIQDALIRPFAELTRDSERRVAIQTLLTAGRDAEANAMQTIWQLEERLGPLSEERKRQVYAIADAEEKANKALEVRREEIGNYLNATRSIRSELEGLFSGKGANFGQVLKDLQAKLAVEKLFGPALRQVDDFVKGGTGIDKAVAEFNSGTTTAGEAAVTFADTLIAQANRISSASAGGLSSGTSDLGNSTWADFLSDFDAAFDRKMAANDNGAGSYDPATGEITVNGNKASVAPIAKPDRNTVGGATLTSYSEMIAGVMTKPLIDAIGGISPELAAKLGPMLNGAIGGMMTGGIPGAVLGGLKELPGISKSLSKALGGGLEGAQTGSMVAGISKSLGIKMSSTGAQIGGAIGSFIPIPGGSLIGSVIGGLLGNLFHSVKSGYAQIRPSGTDVAVTGTYGRTGSLQNDASKAANALIDSVRSLADQLGGSLGGFDMDIGTKDDKFIVNLGATGGTHSFATEEEATRFAVIGAINKGAIQGIRDSTKNLLVAGTDIETQLKKAMDFESVFKRLRAQTDPVGAAIDAVDTEFKRLQGIFKEAGASTAEYADLEKLYGLERTKAVKDAASQMTGALKSLLDDLTIGDNGLSLSDRRANALAKYQPLADQVKAGDVSAYDDFAEAARSLIDISREMYGSQNPYFELFDEVRGITQGALNASTATADQSASSPSIFTPAVAVNDNGMVASSIAAVGSDLGAKLDATNINLGILIKQGLASGNLQSLAQYIGPMWQPQGYF